MDWKDIYYFIEAMSDLTEDPILCAEVAAIGIVIDSEHLWCIIQEEYEKGTYRMNMATVEKVKKKNRELLHLRNRTAIDRGG